MLLLLLFHGLRGMTTERGDRGGFRKIETVLDLSRIYDRAMSNNKVVLLTCVLAVLVPFVHGQTETCLPIASSTQCSAFVPFSISTDSYLVGL